MRKWLAQRMRCWADRLDYPGAPKRTSWCFTQEPGWGTVFNQEGRGCPVWHYGDAAYELAHLQAGQVPGAEDIEWVTVGMRTPAGVHVLGSAQARNGTTTRRAETHTKVDVPVPTTRIGPPSIKTARVPNWVTTLKCEMPSIVSLPGPDYPTAVRNMFKRPGIKG